MKRFATARRPRRRADPVDKRARGVRCAVAAAFVTAPAAVFLVVLAALGAVSAAAAAGVWLAILVAATVGLWPAAAAIDSAAARAARLASDREAPVPSPSFPGLGAPLDRALARLDREWRKRRQRSADTIAMLEATLDALSDPLILLDEAQTVTFANRSAEEAFGPGLRGRALTAAGRAPQMVAAAGRVFGGAAEAAFEMGSEIDGERSYAGCFRAIGGTAEDGPRVVLTLHEITRSVRSERLRAEFVANASHEIRTPLTTLVGVIETLRGPARDDEAMRDEFLAMMEEHAARIGRLVDDLLSLSRIERSEHAAPSGTVLLGPVIERAAEALAWRARSRNVQIAVDGIHTLPPVAGDADELGVVFQNLIDNAIKYGNAEATVRVDVSVEPDAVTVTVCDEGPGIAAEHVPRLTERFYRVDKARSSRLGGTGLGLAIVKHVVQRHRGTLRIDSVPGTGSRFAVRLKRIAAADAHETERQRSADTEVSL